MRIKLIALLTAITIAAAAPARAGESARDSVTQSYTTPSVTVTTTRAEERKNPVPFAEIDKAEITRHYTGRDLPQLLSELPSVMVFSEGGNGYGYSNLSLRGFHQRRISVMVNGIPQNDPEDHNMYWINMPDITSSLSSIQVQRGAGMAGYGSAAIGGSINLTTSNFAKERGALLTTGAAFQTFGENDEIRHNATKYSLEVSSGMVDNYAVYGRLSTINSFGYRADSWSKMQSYFLGFARFDDHFSTQINVFGGPVADALAYTGLPKSYIGDESLRRMNYNYWDYDSTGKNVNWTTSRRAREIENFSQPHYEMLNDWQVRDNITIKSSIFYYSGEGFFDFDGTGWTDASTYQLNEANGYPNASDPQNPIIRAFVQNRHGGWIPRVVWEHENGELTAGLELRWHRSDHWGKLQYAENLPSNYDPDFKFYQYNGERDIYSAFVRETYAINRDLLLNAELQVVSQSYRINNEKTGKFYKSYLTTDGKTVGNGDDLFDINYIFLNPRLGLNYNLDKEQNVYGSLAYTSREPRMCNLYDASSSYSGSVPLFECDTVGGVVRYDFSKPLVNPEKMLNFELGYNYISDRYRFSANGYWMEYFDELVKSGQVDIFGMPIDGNAPRTRHIGLELSGTAKVFDSPSWGTVEISANTTISTNKIIDFDYIADDGSKISLKDNAIAGFPDFMANVRLSYINGGFYASLLTRSVGESRTDNFGEMITKTPSLISELGYADNKLDAYTVCNLDLSYSMNDILSFQNIKVQAQVINLFNKLYAAGAEGKEFFVAAERSFYFGLQFGI